ncbi:MAG TPA: diacylglycerol kinase family protein [Caulobacteraceae bacterium]|jgi:diacylglycerol kinase family enzyme|nr:diacylglycerol kinase family protein [Caulobacteraceae bacterium]
MTDVAGARPPEPPRRRASEPTAAKTTTRRIEIIVNPLSGGVGPRAARECERLLETLNIDANLTEIDPRHIEAGLEQALSSKPDVLVVLAGDGTARAATALAGPKGPLIAPLPGGTMNLLPRALYGAVDWKKALEIALMEGVARPIAGGEVDGRPFQVAAILGSPALWAPAREAVRSGKLRLAYLYARRAARRAFARTLRYCIDDQPSRRGEAVAILSPLISKAMEEPTGLEVAQVDFKTAGDAFRLAAKTLFADWRADSTVETVVAQRVLVSAMRPIPAILDGEPCELGHVAEARFKPCSFRALAPKRILTAASEPA